MSENNTHDALEVLVSCIIYAAAVTVFLLAVYMYNRNLDFLALRVDEKQSIETAVEQDIDIRTDAAQKDTMSKTEVYGSIISVADPDITTVMIDSTVINASTIKLAKNGDERSKNAILNAITGAKYERVNVYDTRDDGDYLCEIDFTSV